MFRLVAARARIPHAVPRGVARAFSTASKRTQKPLFLGLVAAGSAAVLGGSVLMFAEAAPPEPKLIAENDVQHEVTFLTEEDLEEEPKGAYDPETGEINWDCPCLGGMANGPCGEEFKTAFSCFVYSKEEPKGIECVSAFQAMQDCFRRYPEVYAEQLADDPDQQPADAPVNTPVIPGDEPADTKQEPKSVPKQEPKQEPKSEAKTFDPLNPPMDAVPEDLKPVVTIDKEGLGLEKAMIDTTNAVAEEVRHVKKAVKQEIEKARADVLEKVVENNAHARAQADLAAEKASDAVEETKKRAQTASEYVASKTNDFRKELAKQTDEVAQQFESSDLVQQSKERVQDIKDRISSQK